MKKLIGLHVCLFAMLGAAFAQSGNTVTFTLPNATLIGATTVPAGIYTVHEVDSNSGAVILDFSGPGGFIKNVLATETVLSSDADRSHVVLKSDGEHLRLDTVVIEGRGYGFQVVR